MATQACVIQRRVHLVDNHHSRVHQFIAQRIEFLRVPVEAQRVEEGNEENHEVLRAAHKAPTDLEVSVVYKFAYTNHHYMKEYIDPEFARRRYTFDYRVAISDKAAGTDDGPLSVIILDVARARHL